VTRGWRDHHDGSKLFGGGVTLLAALLILLFNAKNIAAFNKARLSAEADRRARRADQTKSLSGTMLFSGQCTAIC
jgi:hypothetical protein